MQDAGLAPVLKMSIHQPFTMLWPTDKALNSLPPERQRWLSSPDHQDQLNAILRAHILRSIRVGGKGGGWLHRYQSSLCSDTCVLLSCAAANSYYRDTCTVVTFFPSVCS